MDDASLEKEDSRDRMEDEQAMRQEEEGCVYKPVRNPI